MTDLRGQLRRSARARVDHWEQIILGWADREFRRGYPIRWRRLNRFLAIRGIRKSWNGGDAREITCSTLRVWVGPPRRQRSFDVVCRAEIQQCYFSESLLHRLSLKTRCCARALAVHEMIAYRKGLVFYGADGRITEPRKRKNRVEHFPA